MARRIAEIEGGQYSRPGKMTVRECVNRWLEARSGTVGAKTHDRYKGIADYYIIPTLGDLPLKKLMPLHVEDALAKWRKEKCKSRKSGPISKRTVYHIFATFSAVMAQAVRWNLIPKNPCDSVTAPTKGHSDVTALNEDQVVHLLQTLKGTLIAAPTQVAVMSGLRRGELLALRWEDIDLENGTIRVTR